MKKALTGDFGNSVLTTNPVMTDIGRIFPATIELATLGTLIGVLLGVPLGVFAAVRRGSFIDQIVRVIGLVGYSVPIFWLGLMGLLLFYAKLGWVAGPGRLDISYEYIVHADHRHLAVDSHAGRVGRLRQRLFATSSCPPRCSAISRSPTSAA